MDTATALATVRRLTASGEARAIRTQARLSLSEMAGMVGVDKSTLFRWEVGERSPRGNAAVRYCRALDALRKLATP